MSRKKLKLAYIANDSMRKSTFNKRKKGLVKKMNELSVLCGIEACTVIYSPFNSTPDVWPSNTEVKNVVERFEKLTEMEQEKKMVNHEDFLRQSISKTVENNKKRIKENKERMLKETMFHILRGEGEQLKLSDQDRVNLCKYIDQYVKELYKHKAETLNDQSHLEYGESSNSAPSNIMMPPPTPIADVGSSSSSVPNLDHVFNTPQLSNESWAMRPMNSSNDQRSADWVSTFGNSFFPGTAAAAQESCYPMMNPVGVYDQVPADLSYPNDNQYHQPQQMFNGYPMMAQDEIYNLNQNQQQRNMLLDDHINYPGQMDFASMDGNNHYYDHSQL